MHKRSPKEKAYVQLSREARLVVKLKEATTELEQLVAYVDYIVDLSHTKRFRDLTLKESQNKDTINQIIGSYLKSNIDLNVVVHRRSPLSHAIGSPELVHLFLTHGADPDFQDEFGETALHRSADYCFSFYHEDFLKSAMILSNVGANFNLKNLKGYDPVSFVDKSFLSSEKQRENFKEELKNAIENPKKIHDIITPIKLEGAEFHFELSKEDERKVKLYVEGNYRALIPKEKNKFFTTLDFDLLSDPIILPNTNEFKF